MGHQNTDSFTMKDILIVEDGLHERKRLEKLFRNAKYLTVAAENAQEAEGLLRIDQFRLVILDIGLGDKSGSFLFQSIKRGESAPYIVIFTGNPSVHLKQRFLDEGAAAYVVKASADAENEALLALVKSLLGSQELSANSGIPLHEFLRLYVDQSSRELFLDSDNQISRCTVCGAGEFVVSFSHKTQLPPSVEGRVVCVNCSSEMDPEIG